MKRKDYLSPEAEMRDFRFEVNFCTSAQTNSLNDFDLLDANDIVWD